MLSKNLLGFGSVALIAAFAACSSDSDKSEAGTGGSAAGGSKTGTGSGGSPATGGLVSATGGSLPTTGGAPNGTGGSTAGSSSTGGNGAGGVSTGGAPISGTAGTTGGKASGGAAGVGGVGGASGGTSAGASSGGMGGGNGGASAPSQSGLPTPPGAADQVRPSGTPDDITVLNWAGFKGAVTYSFDDNTDSQIANYEQLQAAGGQYTFYLWTNRPTANNSIWKKALADGHEIGNHSVSHDPSKCTTADLTGATTFIETNLQTKPWTFAAPNGNGCYKTPASGLFFINRGVGPATPVMPNGNSDPLTLNCYIPGTGQQASKFNSELDAARTQGGWAIYVIHGFSQSDGSYQPIDIEQMTTAIEYAVSKGDMWVGSMVNVGAYWLGQKAFSSAMSTTSGMDKTWSWTLPQFFPTGKYLRVKVGGGTLKQGGVALPWDPHGYYEISLDAKSVTLSP